MRPRRLALRIVGGLGFGGGIAMIFLTHGDPLNLSGAAIGIIGGCLWIAGDRFSDRDETFLERHGIDPH